MTDAELALGIDLGTYNSVAAVLLDEQPVVLRAKEGQTDQGLGFPSFVEFDPGGDLVRVGELARRSLHVYPDRVVWGVKRLIGKSFSQVKESGNLDRFKYKISKADDGGCRIQVGKKTYNPRDISRFILEKIKSDAEAGFNPIGQPIRQAIITVPAGFSPVQKTETERAAKEAGFEKVRLIPEPTAAALAYRVQVERKDQYIAVIDLGAGTLDVTIALLHVDSRGELQTEEKGHGANTALGGLDLDQAILEYLRRKHGDIKKLEKKVTSAARLMREIEIAKMSLSTCQEARIAFNHEKGEIDMVLTRNELETAVGPVVERCRGPIRVALQEACLSPTDISHVLLVGGPMRMPIVRRMVAEEFSVNQQVVQEIAAVDVRGFPVDPMEAVARGAVLGSFGGITPAAYGLLYLGLYYDLMPRRVRYPHRTSRLFGMPSGKRSVVLSLVENSLDPDTSREVYREMIKCQFDYCPDSGYGAMQIDAELTENGTLNLDLVQPSTDIRLPLYNVSRLEGRRISTPARPQSVPLPQSYGDTEGGGSPPPPPPMERWTEKELKDAIRSANLLLNIAQTKLPGADGQAQQQIKQVAADLKQWIEDTEAPLDVRAPAVRNLLRSLVNALATSGLIRPDELRELQWVIRK